MKIPFILSLIVISFGIALYLLVFNKKKNVKLNIFWAVVICIIAITILAYPLMEYANPYTRAFSAFIYATKCIGMGQNLDVLSKISLTTPLGYLYFILINFLFLALPALTLSFVVTFIEKMVAYIKFKISKNKMIIVFSELNDKSLTIAKNMNKKCAIIFANVNEKVNLDIKAIKMNQKINEIEFNNNSDVTIYMINQNEEENLNETLELINKYKNRDKTKIYVVNNNIEAPTILDSTDKGKINVEIINEKERMIFNLLNDKPLFLNSINKTISILIVGCNDIGKEFLYDSIWCGMLPGYKLRLLVVDPHADTIKESINVENPELLGNYDINFINKDIKSKEAIEAIKENKDINYIMISMKNDDDSIDTAIMLRRLFLRDFDREPIINLYIENKYKQEQINNLTNEKGYSFNLNSFGSIMDLYKQYNDKGSDLEKLTIKIHLSYDPEDTELKRYNLKEYNKRSSRACAVHIKYKLFSILGDKYTDDMQENQRLFKEMYSKDILDMLARNEHERWMAYMRSIGYVYVSTKEVAKYYAKNKHYIHYLARLHPALVDYDKLDEVSKELSKITSKEINLKENDSMIIKNLYKTIDL